MLVTVAASLLLAQDAPNLQAMLSQVSPERLEATVRKLASFQTRNTLSPTLTDAAEWLAGEYNKIPGVKAELMKYTLPKGRRVPEDKEVVQVVARLEGKDDRIVLVGGHLDSLNLQVDPVTGRAPGANDDASGTALALELARVMSAKKWKHTLVFVGFTGEEQGLHGARALAARAKTEGWKIEAVLNCDTVGSSANLAGQSDPFRIRVFSEEAETHKSRELARIIDFLTRGKIQVEPDKPFGVKLVFRRDRFGRGGDHTPFAEAGFSAVRFIEVHEEYTRQHTPDDLPEHMDFAYLANVSRCVLAAMAALADAGPTPTDVRIDMRQGHDTTVTWKPEPGTRYVVYWRETTSPVWQWSRDVGESGTCTVEKVNKDDHIFAVGAAGGIPVAAN